MSPTQQNKLTGLVKRFLDVMRILFLAVAIIWPITVLVVGLNIPSDPEQRHTDVNFYLNFRIDSDVSREAATATSSEGMELMKGHGDVKLNNTQSVMSWYLSGAISQVLLFIFLYGLLTMRKLFVSLADGNTFTRENAERLRRIGYVFIGWNVVSPLLQYFWKPLYVE